MEYMVYGIKYMVQRGHPQTSFRKSLALIVVPSWEVGRIFTSEALRKVTNHLWDGEERIILNTPTAQPANRLILNPGAPPSYLEVQGTHTWVITPL